MMLGASMAITAPANSDALIGSDWTKSLSLIPMNLEISYAFKEQKLN